ncbi:MAG: hypothetical protein IH584_08605, partial [Candidatus Aminicenantes bacterium]|nr:hypothetical protein [Candidatus Aminicenantes bacterium]
MNHKCRVWKKSIMLLLIFVSGLFQAFAAESARDKLAELDKALDARLTNWEQSLDGSRWEVYKP